MSSRYRRKKAGVAGHDGCESNSMIIEVPILTSTCPIEPSWLYIRLPGISCAAKACSRKAIVLAESFEISQGVRVSYPCGSDTADWSLVIVIFLLCLVFVR